MGNNKKQNPFRKTNFGENTKTKRESEWGKVKFNPISKTAVVEKATPWSQFKQEIIQKQQQEEQDLQLKAEDSKAKEFHKRRQEIHRRFIIENKRKEPTQWEDFSDEPQSKKMHKEPPKGKFYKLASNIKEFDSLTKDSFDSRLLTVEQNTFLKKVITKGVIRRHGSSLKRAVEDMKLHGVLKSKKLKQ